MVLINGGTLGAIAMAQPNARCLISQLLSVLGSYDVFDETKIARRSGRSGLPHTSCLSLWAFTMDLRSCEGPVKLSKYEAFLSPSSQEKSVGIDSSISTPIQSSLRGFETAPVGRWMKAC